MSHSLSPMATHCTAWTAGLTAQLWGISPKAAAFRLHEFQRMGLVASVSIAVRYLPLSLTHLYRHDAKTAIDPEMCRELAARCAVRYRSAKIVTRTLYAVTRKARNILGGVGTKPTSPMTASHDLLLTEVFLASRHRGVWRYEPEPPGGRRAFEKQPDAGIFDAAGMPLVWVEIAGNYRAERFAKLLEYSNGSGIPLEVW